MIWKLADNIISPLGQTTEENYQAVKVGRSALKRYEGWCGIPDTFTASLFSLEQRQTLTVEGLSRFESLAFLSAQEAVRKAGIDITDRKTVFILSTTKANIECLKSSQPEDADACNIGVAAKRIAERLGIPNEPLAVCNACISGISAIMLAQRLLENGLYDYAVVCGADVQCPFTIAGFLSLKAVSEDACRPFDLERTGLNLGEAAATMVFARDGLSHASPLYDEMWSIERSAVRNDAYHISSPSRDGTGARLALQYVLGDTPIDDLAVINAHGTATLFNDQMESVAIEHSGLGSVPVNALKGYFGHTLGAAGILEAIITMAALDDNTLLATRGFDSLGVSGHISVLKKNESSQKNCFIKMISGFGGGNGALLCRKTASSISHPSNSPLFNITKSHQVRMTPSEIWVNGSLLCSSNTQDGNWLTGLYKKYIGNYPKFYKMDPLSQLGFFASELLLKGTGRECSENDGRAIILFNASSSAVVDKEFLSTMANEDDFFPSPALFVYTLPNMVTGEIAIRNECHAETAFYICRTRDDDQMWTILRTAFSDTTTKSIIGGWIDYYNNSHFEADLFLAENNINSKNA